MPTLLQGSWSCAESLYNQPCRAVGRYGAATSKKHAFGREAAENFTRASSGYTLASFPGNSTILEYECRGRHSGRMRLILLQS